MTIINEAILNTLSDDAIPFAGEFLELVFLMKESDLGSFDADQIDTIRTLISGVRDMKMKQQMLRALAHDTIYALETSFSSEDYQALFLGYADMKFLEVMFRELEDQYQTDILNALFNHNEERYAFFKKLLKYKLSMLGGILIKQENVLKQFMEREKHLILDLFEDPNATLEDSKVLSASFAQKYEPDDLELLCKELISTFTMKKLSLADSKAFSIYLKFFFFIGPFVETYSRLYDDIKPLLDLLITSLHGMPSGEWAVKVLNQLPMIIIQSTLKLLSAFPTLSQFEKKQMYSKLLTKIKTQSSIKEGDNVRFALSQL